MRKSPYWTAIWCFSASEMGFIASRNGLYCKTKKWPLNINHWYSIYYKKPLIFRVFAPEDDSARKYALIFRGISGNWEGKIGNRLQSESVTTAVPSAEKENACTEYKPIYYIETYNLWIYARPENHAKTRQTLLTQKHVMDTKLREKAASIYKC